MTKLNMDKQIELKAKIGEIQLQLESLQAQANQLSQMKNKATAELIEEMKKPMPEVKPAKSK